MYIYKITNKINGKIYIGQTSQKPNQRFNEHCRKKKLKNISIINQAILKYGRINFSFELICYCFSIEEANKQEIYFIKYYDAVNSGYNIDSGGKNRRLTKDTIEKIRATRKKVAITRQDIKTGQQKHYESIMAATREGFTQSAIRKCLYENFTQHKGFYWFKAQTAFKPKKSPNELKRKPIIAFDKNGYKIYEFESLTEAKKSGFSKPGITNCCKGLWKQYKNLIWKYKE